MHQKRKRSTNYNIYRNIRTKLRQVDPTPDVAYLLVYTFLYKHCSDSLKDYFSSVVEDQEMTLDEAFRDEYLQMKFRNDALQMFGYYINRPDAFIDEVINESYQERFFIPNFFRMFKNNVEFEKGSNYERYFKFIFNCVDNVLKLNGYDFSGESYLIVKDLIYTISKLNIFEEELPFSTIFDFICQSRVFRVEQDPEYINEILTELVHASKFSSKDIYNPFFNDGSSIISLSNKFDFGYAYGKCNEKVTLCCSIVKLLMNYFSLNNIFLEFGNAMDSVDIGGASFDVIISKLPPVGGWSSRAIHKNQSREFSRRNKRKQLEDMLSIKFDMDEKSFSSDSQLNDALENLLEKMDLEMDSNDFVGEYEPLNDSEYLFLINLINCLKDDGVMVVSISQSFLFKNSLELLRKYLVYEHNYLDTVISIPEGLGRTTRPEVICVFRKNRINDDILFVDLTKNFKTKKAQHIVPGAIRRNLSLSNDTFNQLLRVYDRREIIERYSNVVSIREIAQNEFNLSVSRYVDTFEGEFIQLKDLANEKKEITSQIKELNKKIDEMMEELDLRF